MTGFWTDEKDQSLRRMAAEGVSTRKMAAAVGATHVTVWKRMARLGIRAAGSGSEHDNASAPAQVTAAPVADHIESYNRARRGFHVPHHLQSQYFDLLKAGVPIAEACRRLDIKVNQAPEA